MSVELSALAAFLVQWDILEKLVLLGRLADLAPSVHAVFPVLLDQLELKACEVKLARVDTPSRFPS